MLQKNRELIKARLHKAIDEKLNDEQLLTVYLYVNDIVDITDINPTTDPESEECLDQCREYLARLHENLKEVFDHFPKPTEEERAIWREAHRIKSERENGLSASGQP